MSTPSKTVASPDLGNWLEQLPEAPGVRPLNRMPSGLDNTRRAAYRRRIPPGSQEAPLAPRTIMTLVDEGGVLRWREGLRTGIGTPGLRRAGGRASLPAGRVIKQFAVDTLPASEVNQALVDLDIKLTPGGGYASAPEGLHGIRRWMKGAFVPFPDPSKAAGKKVLLFIHGTFSNNESLLTDGLNTVAEGRALLAAAEKRYDLVLGFDHHTLSVSPVMNAFDLAALLRPAPASVDIVCHSRGGLVTRWFCEGFAPAGLKRRAVLVASPIGGTSFAAAENLPRSLNLLTNISNVLRVGSFFIAASGLMRVLASVIGNTRSVDAAISLIPGLKAQSRVRDNPELLRLQHNTGDVDYGLATGDIRYFAVTGNFEPQGSGWEFLRWFRQPKEQLVDWMTDRIFPGDNDLVVDTDSMRMAGASPLEVAHHYPPGSGVHHVNYFVQPQTAAAIRASFNF